MAQGDAVTIVASGYMVSVAMKAVGELAKAGVKCNLFDAYCLPLDTEPIFAVAEKSGGVVLSVEDNYVGGLGSALAESAAMTGRIRVHAMTCTRLPKSGKSGDDVLAYCGLAVGDIVEKAKSLAG